MDEDNYRILVVDDTPCIHEDFRKILKPEQKIVHDALDEINSLLVGQDVPKTDLPPFEIDSAYQAEEALAMVQKALSNGRPYAVAFVDVVMPPGEDGIMATKRMWELDPDIQTVICTAYAKYSSQDIVRILGKTERLFILKKPFDSVEGVQLAIALTKRWNLNQAIQRKMDELQRSVVGTEHHTKAQQSLNDLKATIKSLKRSLNSVNPSI